MTRQLSRSHCILHFCFRSLFTLFYFSTLRFLGWFINPELCETRVHMFMVGTDISLPTALPDESQPKRKDTFFMSLRGFDRMATFEAPGVRRACLFTYLSLLSFHRAVFNLQWGFFLSALSCLPHTVTQSRLDFQIWIVLSSVSFSKRFSKPIFCF